MKARGIEPIPDGVSEADGFKWCIGCIEKCLPKAEQCGVHLALENHWGLTGTPEGLLEVAKAIQSPWLGVLLLGYEPFSKTRTAYPDRPLRHSSRPTYYGGGEWYTLDLDYKRIARILADAGYTGYVSLEMEGKEDPDTAVPKSIAMLREAFAD